MKNTNETILDSDAEKLEEIKNNRPTCPCHESGKHVWSIYRSEGIQRCHDCEYEEEFVYVGQ